MPQSASDCRVTGQAHAAAVNCCTRVAKRKIQCTKNVYLVDLNKRHVACHLHELFVGKAVDGFEELGQNLSKLVLPL